MMKGGLRSLFFKNWWVIALLLLTYGFYVQAIHKKNHLVRTLQQRVTDLSLIEKKERAKRKELLLRIQSADDLDWVELVLKEKLGVAGEGEVKVVFE